ncbi:aminoglycoside phosphotransferase family protein [Microbacterium sp. M3]|uniref:Aminoglycoside phosphotransferase family protein n=1 Tax=Microbacterium arthrosphaerae TaxID=792652 RepID=A0ABU4H0V8_9MICO|nr:MULTISPECIES: aminoglycoside phosphotransferase family protein [Microbacterium]MDW4572895.1 aminoglycoside phosphotransferase family protein [Microbacterium arthrosphaerae]MDW7606750.1 aminoglycoside phosphotransferase family protein [Microbacterium sp. M3]
MPDKPSAEVAIDAPLIRRLLAAQAEGPIPGAQAMALAKVAEGWDSEVWRLGDDYAVRLPRRALAAPLVRHEQAVLAGIAARLTPLGVRVPAPVVHGVAGDGYPWAWSVVPWIHGERALDVDVAHRTSWAPLLAQVLGRLHTPAPADHPLNPFRGNPLSTRTDAVEGRARDLRSRGTLDAASLTALLGVWRAGVAATPWQAPPVWIHGDLHPGNLVARDGTLAGVIDFGDVTAGDPAYDLAVAWLAFDAAGRRRFIEAATGYDDDVWVRARAWAAAVALMLLAHSDDNPDYFALGRDAAAEVRSDTRA